jgi:hypothetical protein
MAVLSFLAALPASAQHLGSRQQWQPQTENDPRLQQPVRLEIIGRAAITGLPMLSEKTGVSLGVAPENLDTVGERKFTAIAQGCTLKAIMVQLCEALQECHWDVDRSDEHLVYLLHRNADADLAEAQQDPNTPSPVEAEQKEARRARLEATRAALKMTPEELTELEKTEPILARVVRDPRTRMLMEGILSLSQDQLAGFVDNGSAGGLYFELPAATQRAADLLLDTYVEDFRRKAAQPNAGEQAEENGPRLERLLAGLKQCKEGRSPDPGQDPSSFLPLVVTVSDNGSGYGGGIALGISLRLKSDSYGTEQPVIPARYLSALATGYATHWLRLLQATGVPDEAAAREILEANGREPARLARDQLEARRKAEWIEPTDPDLLKTVNLARGLPQVADWEQSLAAQTGLSLVSDHFSGGGRAVTGEMAAGLPLWRTLYLLCESGLGEKQMKWRKVGGCLVLRHLRWRQRVQEEAPESLVFAYQEKLRAQGGLTLDDLAAFASQRPGFTWLPRDLTRAGLTWARHARWSLGFYSSLIPAQLAQARTEAGLPYSEMTLAQRRQLADVVRRQSLLVSPQDLRAATFRLTEEKSRHEVGDRRFLQTITRFRLQFPDQMHEEEVVLTAEDKTPAEATPPGK